MIKDTRQFPVATKAVPIEDSPVASLLGEMEQSSLHFLFLRKRRKTSWNDGIQFGK